MTATARRGSTPDSRDARRDPEGRTAVLDQVARALARIEYGSILIKVHQGQVVSIETSVKERLA